MKWAGVLLLFPVLAFGQLATLPGSGIAMYTPPVASGVVSYYPTNITGYPALSFYIVDSYYTTSPSPTLPDLYTNHWNLVHTNAGNSPTLMASGPGGKSYLQFVGNYLTNDQYAATQPNEVVMVIALTNINLTYIWGGTNTGSQKALIFPSGTIDFAAPTTDTASVKGFRSNEWVVLDFVANGASSVIYSNNVAGATVNPGSAGLSGFTLGNKYDLINGVYMSFAEMVTYRTNLDTVSRSNLFYYFTNKYNIQ